MTHPLGTNAVPAPGPRPPFPPELLDTLLRGFLTEDLGAGDVTAAACFPDPAHPVRAVIRSREACTVAGVTVAARVFTLTDGALRATPRVTDGDAIPAGSDLLTIGGPVAPLLSAERVALNLFQRLCGVATITAQFVSAAAGSGAAICDTRKTTPGLRLLEKYAVRCGGGVNHRFGLFDAVLIKDNHIEACGSVTEAVTRARRYAPAGTKIEVEVEDIEQLGEAVAAGADLLLLDNMDVETMRAAMARVAGRLPLEASGGVTLETVGRIAATGVQFISVGALTHSAPAIDLSLEL
jgi:nicotinate-nucleotide pyrophosphorylase (carboxylating)